jgi:prepilin-type N-terminal cleavage/methylation domain-containing protein
MNRPSPKRRSLARSAVRGGFTMIELLMVMIIIAILIALLLPVVNSAMRTARNAAVSSEISQLAQALESFKSKYGDYPPSRVLLDESGNYGQWISNSALSSIPDPTSPASNDINAGQLAQRSLAAMRKFFPKVTFMGTNATPPLFNSNSYWYDYNGNGTYDPAYVLHGHEALVFFLGGIPAPSSLPSSGTFVSTSTFGMTGFGKDPTNPFSNSILLDSRLATPGPNPMYNPNRQGSLFEFNASRLFLDPNGLSGIPGYYDSLGNDPPTSGSGGSGINFYVYFSGYGNGSYDANDVNFSFEADPTTAASPIGLAFQHGSATYVSPSPNPYTTTISTTVTPAGTSTGTATVTFQKAQSFQIFSSGVDGLYGVGGQYIPITATSTSATNTLPLDATGNTFESGAAVTTGTVRNGEKDNITNFKAGTLQ